jgi:hypothetical protein
MRAIPLHELHGPTSDSEQALAQTAMQVTQIVKL